VTNLKYLRLMAQMSQAELAEKANISRTTYANIEAGRQSMGPLQSTMKKIAKALNCTTDELDGEHKEEN
jgi:transcriptional regulator with XRE-family HTH domain